MLPRSVSTQTRQQSLLLTFFLGTSNNQPYYCSMHYNSIIPILISLILLPFVSAYTCTPQTPPEECLKSASAWSQRMKIPPKTLNAQKAPTLIQRSPEPEPTIPCQGMAMMDGPPSGCSVRRGRPSPSATPAVSTTFATVAATASISIDDD